MNASQQKQPFRQLPQRYLSDGTLRAAGKWECCPQFVSRGQVQELSADACPSLHIDAAPRVGLGPFLVNPHRTRL